MTAQPTPFDPDLPVFRYHLGGKLAVAPRRPLAGRADLSLAYTPGVAEISRAIAADPTLADVYTSRANTVAVITDGTAVLGLGDIGPAAALPVMEGKALLFKHFADIDAVPICLDTRDVDELVDTMRALIADDAVVRIELRGAGKAFCAGGDPGEFGTTRDTTLAHLIRSSANAAPLLLAAAPKLHAFVHGAAVGAGCELAAFASHVTASVDATFALPEVSMGLVPGAGGTVSVTRRIGRSDSERARTSATTPTIRVPELPSRNLPRGFSSGYSASASD